MEYSQNRVNKNDPDIDYELDLTSDKKIHYIEKQNKSKNEIEKLEIDFIIKLIEFGFFLSGFVFVYAILKLNNKYKKIKYERKDFEDLYNKKIYKKKKNSNYY